MQQPPVRVTRSRTPDVPQSEDRRATSPQVLRSNAARQATGGVISKLSLWQTRIAYLRGLAIHDGTDGALQEEIGTLAGLIREEQLQFHAAIETLPPDIATHDRIVDTRRALERASEALLSIGTSLGA